MLIASAGCTERSVADAPDCTLRALAHAGGSAGGHLCAIAEDESLWCWGVDTFGQLGQGEHSESNSLPRPVPGGDWSQAGVGGKQSCATRTDGSLWCWGGNDFGQLGLGAASDDPVLRPTRVGTANDWTSVAAGGVHSCGLRGAGTLWCWGGNDSGALALGSDEAVVPMPARVGDAQDWDHVTLGIHHGCGVRRDGSLWCWGDNALGQLGQGLDLQPFPSPTQVGIGQDWSLIRTGAGHTCALARDGSLWCWGSHQSGALGLGEEDEQNPLDFEPRRVGDATDWVDLALGGFQTCARKTDESLWCWGQNGDGELGVGFVGDVWVPTRLAGNGWLDVALAGFDCGIAADGSPACWGFFVPPHSVDEGPMREPESIECVAK